MADVKHDHQVLGVVDLVQHSPVATQAGTVDASQLRAERPANPLGIIEEGPGDELGCCGGDSEGYSRSARVRSLAHADSTVMTVCPIWILSPLFSHWAARMRRPFSQVPLDEPRSSTYHRPRATWKRAW